MSPVDNIVTRYLAILATRCVSTVATITAVFAAEALVVLRTWPWPLLLLAAPRTIQAKELDLPWANSPVSMSCLDAKPPVAVTPHTLCNCMLCVPDYYLLQQYFPWAPSHITTVALQNAH